LTEGQLLSELIPPISNSTLQATSGEAALGRTSGGTSYHRARLAYYP